MRTVYKQCPRCQSKDTLKIIYGMPTDEALLSVKYWIGGCCIEIGKNNEILSPEYHCKVCWYMG